MHGVGCGLNGEVIRVGGGGRLCGAMYWDKLERVVEVVWRLIREVCVGCGLFVEIGEDRMRVVGVE